MFMRSHVKSDRQKCAQNSFDPKASQIEAFANYISYIALKPAQILDMQLQMYDSIVTLMTLPITIPAAIIASPIFLLSRRVCVTKDQITDFFEERKKKKIQNLINQAEQKEVRLQVWQKAVEQASNNLLIKNKKRLIIVIKLPKIQKISNDQEFDKQEKQFIFIFHERMSVLAILNMLKKQINRQSDSIHLISNAKILNLDTKISSLESNHLGIIRLHYTKIQTFG